MPRKEYSDTAVETTLVGNLAIGGLSMTIASATGYPAGTYQFVVKVDDELMLCDGRSGTTITINSSGRGFSGTTAIAHTAGAPIQHVWESASATDLQRHVYDVLHDDHTQYQKESEKNQNNGYAGLDGTGVVPAARIDALIARDTEVTSTMTTHVGAVDPHGDRAVANAALVAHENDTTAVHGIPDTTVLVLNNDARLYEAGDLKTSARSAPSTGWLLCDGAAVSRTTYAALFSAIASTYGNGDGTTTFNVPDYRGRAVLGAGAGPGLTARTRGQVGGAETHLLVTSEMPTHTHTQNSHNHTQNAHGHGIQVSYWDNANGAARQYGVGYKSLGTDSLNLGDIQTTTAVNIAATAVNQNSGGDGTHNNMQPYGVANVFIKT